MSTTPNNQQCDQIEDDWEMESKMWQEMAAIDCLKNLGPISKEEHDYYEKIVADKK